MLILASFHGLPESYVAAGDPYYRHCQETTRLLREKLGLSEMKLQARVPVALRARRMAQALCAGHGGEPARPRACSNLVMIMPGFAADCVETLEEVAIGLSRDIPRKRRRKLLGRAVS